MSWLDEQLRGHEITRTGEVIVTRDRPWGTMLRADTTQGPVWLKAPGPASVFEVELYQLLCEATPDHVLVPLGVDVERGWVLLPDGGTSLGEGLSDTELTDALTEALPRYAQLQRDLAPLTERMLTLGVTDMRPAVMPQRFDEAVEVTGRWVAELGDAGDRDAHRQVVAKRATFVSWCERLGEGAAPASLDHNDLHPWNILVDGAGRTCFYDWGDGVLAHSFASMLMGVGFLRYRRRVGPDDPDVLRLRDAYLEAWTDLAPRGELVEELDVACWVAVVARTLTWERSVRAGVDGSEEFTRAPWETLRALLADSWIAAM